MNNIYGLIGKSLSHSFSQRYFSEKFKKENIGHVSYHLFELENIGKFLELIKITSELKGLNITIPYKEAVIPFLSQLSDEAMEIGAVNTVKIERKDNQLKLLGFNTDVIGFKDSLLPLLSLNHKKALVLGSGGGAKAVCYVLRQLGIEYLIVSRNDSPFSISYPNVNKQIINDHTLIVNTSPLGMYPNINETPSIPYEYITSKHFLYDLIYNPKQSLFLKKGKAQGAVIKNGEEMLILQAEASWKIWNKTSP